MSAHQIHWEDLSHFTATVLAKLKVAKEQAEIVADNLVSSNLRGIDSHGVARLQRYIDGIKTGYIISDVSPELEIDGLIYGKVDGKNGLGQVAGNLGMVTAIQKAEEHGFGIITVSNSNHYGYAGYYTLMALEKNFIGISMTNSAPLVVPTFGKNAVFGTNPIAVAVPAGEKRPWVMDFATSVVPRGKLEVYKRLSKKLPDGWATDEKGHVTNDPERVLKNLVAHTGGGILALGGAGELMGGHKGYGLAVMVDIFCGVLSGANFGPDLVSKKNGQTNFPRIGHMFMALNPEIFMDIKNFKKRMDDYINLLVNSEKAEGESRIYVHGEKEYEEEERRKKQGIPLDQKTYDSLKGISEEYQVELKLMG